MEFAAVGHILLYGQTHSGKTYFAKYLIEKLEVNKVFVFTATPDEWSDIDDVYTENFEDNIEIIKNECTLATTKALEQNQQKPKYIIVLDDFNEQINTRSNDNYREMFTRFRHCGVRIINLAHTINAVGPTARTNSRYVCYMSTISDKELKNVSDTYYSKNYFPLKKFTDNARQENEYNCIIIDGSSRKIFVDRAPIKVTIQNDLHPKSSLATDPANTVYTGIADPISLRNQDGQMGSNSTMSFGNKSAYNMVDNSTNNIQISHNIKMKQLHQQNTSQNNMKMENYYFSKEMEKIAESDIVKSLIRSPFITSDDRKRILKDINKRLRPNYPFTLDDYDEGVKMYMEVIHKEKISEPPLRKKILSSAIDAYGSNDPFIALNSGYNFVNNLLEYSRSS